MNTLAYDLKNICSHNRDGSHATQANRFRILQAIGRELQQGGYKLPAARSLKPKHVQYLVQFWQTAGLTAGTIKNRMGALRWLAEKVNKGSIIPRDNAALGIAEREHHKGNKAQKLDLAQLSKVECPYMRLSVRFMAAFGLRMEEALKFRPKMADKGDYIALKASWTKGGRYREIPVHSQRHRDLLDEAKMLCGEGSLIPLGKNYIQHRKAFEYATLKAGFSNLHGLRHNYAQARFKQLSGFAAPKAGGPGRGSMTAAQRSADETARLTVSNELGHDRLDVTVTYLGGMAGE